MKIYLAADMRGHSLSLQPHSILFSFFDLGCRKYALTKRHYKKIKQINRERKNENLFSYKCTGK